MIDPQVITFFCPSKVMGGIVTLFSRLSKFLSRNPEYQIYYIDYPDGVARGLLQNENVTFIDYYSNIQTKIEFNTTIVMYFLDIVGLQNKLDTIDSNKFLLWFLHPHAALFTLPLGRLMSPSLYTDLSTDRVASLLENLYGDKWEEIKQVLERLNEQQALAFMDSINLTYQQKTFKANIPFLDLKAINSRHKAEIQEAISGVIDSGWYILGEAVKQFEEARERV